MDKLKGTITISSSNEAETCIVEYHGLNGGYYSKTCLVNSLPKDIEQLIAILQDDYSDRKPELNGFCPF